MSGGRRVYVVELSDAAGERSNPAFPNVYVGETGRTVEERFATHKAGGRTASRTVTRFGLQLRPDLYEGLPEYETEAESVAAEQRLRRKLERQGYTVHGGTMGMAQTMAVRFPRDGG
ncbi:MAG: hypothetical protein P1T08_13255 [Acidimicrobiia bacterium]|nr:hypothetical protein [Acidimicrobiia bacterium]